MNKKFVAALVLMSTLAAVSSCAQKPEPEAEKARIEAIVQEYIRSHPAEIAESLNKYARAQQQRNEDAQMKAALNNRVDVPVEGSPASGPEDARITLVEFSDFQCPFCARVNGVLKKIRENHKAEIRFVFKNMPLRSIHPQAVPAAMAALAAGEQGKFWEYRDMLFSKQQEWSNGGAEAWFAKYAETLGLDVEKFKNDMNDEKIRGRVKEDEKLASKLGVRATPTFYVNGARVQGARDYDYFEKVIGQVSKEGAKG